MYYRSCTGKSSENRLGIRMRRTCLMQSMWKVDMSTCKIMVKCRVVDLEEFEDVSGVTQPSPNAKLCGVVRGVLPMKKSKTCAYFDGEISVGKSTMRLLVLARKSSSFTFFLPSFISLLSTQPSSVPLHPFSGLPSLSSIRRVFHHEHKRTKEGHVLEDT